MPKAPSPKEIRERFSDYTSEWSEIREEARTDMRYVMGDPWDEEDKRERKAAGRPCISLDNIGQFINQTENNIRQNRRAIQVLPKAFGANDEDAEHRASIIRGIENQSNAQEAYITAFVNALHRGYGFALIRNQVDDSDEKTFNQVLRIKRVPNPDCVLLADDYKQADASDCHATFYTDLIAKKQYKRLYPKAKVQDFEGETAKRGGVWIREHEIQIAELWMIHVSQRKLLLVDAEEGPTAVYEDEIEAFKAQQPAKWTPKILRDRMGEKKEVVQYITNGLEILDEIPWAGSRIPIAACFGKELFIDKGDGDAKRVLMSMVRLARDPQMLHAYLSSLECEVAGSIPKTPFVGAVGQFESDAEAWETLTKVPRAFIQYDLVTDASGQQVLPPPQRPQFSPDFQPYEMAKDSAARAVQASMGINPLPTAAARKNEKSGVALERIETVEAIGAFHFTDAYDSFLSNVGFQVNELIAPIYDTARDVQISRADGTHGMLRINDEAYAVQNPEGAHLHTTEGEYGVTVSAGPSYQSQREAASDFADHMLELLPSLGMPPQVMAKIVALCIRLKDVGPLGKEMADIVDPQDKSAQELAAAQQQMAQQQQAMAELQAELQKLKLEKAGKVIDNEYKMKLKEFEGTVTTQIAQLNADLKAYIANVQTKAQDLSERRTLFNETQTENHHAAHEAGMQAVEHAHAHSIADKNAANASLTQAADQAHQQSMAEQQPEPEAGQ